ncbi:MAG: response regulator [Corallococcus sp.]|nr:response regulator [Corallococcus sp.]
MRKTDETSISGLHVSVAENNEINAETLEEHLDCEGVICDAARDGKEVFEKFQQCKEGEYDFIFMDVQMPIMNGYEATRAIRACSYCESKTIKQ